MPISVSDVAADGVAGGILGVVATSTLFAAEGDMSGSLGGGMIGAVIAIAGGLLLQYISTRHRQKTEDESRSLTDAWKMIDSQRAQLGEEKAARERLEGKLEEERKAHNACSQRIIRLEARIEQLEGQELKKTRTPRHGAHGGSDVHDALPADPEVDPHGD